eukprot:TRINITY_DN2429_c0_g1_i2.p2 TRINITY_DN2429_c0_g1~~TRINITY_DN2429_c0_g1_i2.p2  ORF type:complete len:212 (-),score=69.90 TRINITY_DN2429_c0_g1_i2:75-710(-)
MKVGDKCPAIGGLEFVKGEEVVVGGEEGSGRVLVVECWATWCPPCVKSIPHLTELQKKYEDRNVTFVGVSGEKVEKIRAFVEKQGDSMDYRVACDSDQEVQSKLQDPFDVSGIPHAFIIDTSNVVRYSGHPMQPEFEATLNACAAEPAAAPPKELEAIPLITLTADELRKTSVKGLKEIMNDRKIKFDDCIEKSELVNRVLETACVVQYYK